MFTKYISLIIDSKLDFRKGMILKNSIIDKFGIEVKYMKSYKMKWLEWPVNFYDYLIFINRTGKCIDERIFPEELEIFNDNNGTEINISSNRCDIFTNNDSLIKSINIFTEKYLDDFVLRNFPEIINNTYFTPKEEEPNINEDPHTTYKSELDNELQFYKRKDGNWFLKYYNEECIISETKGVLYIHHLLENPNRLFLLSELWCSINGGDVDILARDFGELKTKSKSEKSDGDHNFQENKLNHKENRKLNEFQRIRKEKKQEIINKIESLKTERDHYRNLYTSVLSDNNYKPDQHNGVSKTEKLNEYQKLIDYKEKTIKGLQKRLKDEFPTKNKKRDIYRQRIKKAKEAFYEKLEKKNMLTLVNYFNITIKSYKGYIYTPKDISDTWILSKD